MNKSQFKNERIARGARVIYLEWRKQELIDFGRGKCQNKCTNEFPYLSCDYTFKTI